MLGEREAEAEEEGETEGEGEEEGERERGRGRERDTKRKEIRGCLKGSSCFSCLGIVCVAECTLRVKCCIHMDVLLWRKTKAVLVKVVS